MEYDVIVVGCGVAGLTAAISAAENGMNVCILEQFCPVREVKKIGLNLTFCYNGFAHNTLL